MAFFNKILGLGLDENKTVECVNTYDWSYGFILFNNETWGDFEKEYMFSYLRDHDIVSQMKQDSNLTEQDFVYLTVNLENVLEDFSQTPAGSTVLSDYDANCYTSETDLDDFYNNLTPQLQQQFVSLLRANSNVKQYKFNELK